MRYLIICLMLLLPRAALADGCADERWARYLSPGPQSFERREVISLAPERTLIAIEFGPLEGDFAKLYLFLEDDGTCFPRAVSVSSYASTNAFAVEMGKSRIYHTDLYELTGHSTLGMSDTPPSYEDARRIALEILR